MMIKKSKKKADDDENEAVQTRIKELHSESSHNILAEMMVGAGGVHHSMNQLVVDNLHKSKYYVSPDPLVT